MKIGVVISMYDEIEVVQQTITNLKKNDIKIVVIQSEPGKKEMELDGAVSDIYEKMPDLSGGRDKYARVIEEKKEGKAELIGPIALTRNFSRGFSLIRDFDVDYVVAITGDTKITNLKGISKICIKMKKENKIVAGTRSIGYTMYDEFGNFTQFQHRKITNIMPQFFIANINAVRKGLFCNTQRTNKYTTEQCFGDEIIRYCNENNLKFFDVFYRICDYAYPRFIDGLYYNPEQLGKIPPPFGAMIDRIRYWSGRRINDLITRIFKIIEKKIG